MAELLIKGTKVAEKVNNVVFQYSDMYVNKQTFTQDLTLDASYNATMTGPITVNNLTVNGNISGTGVADQGFAIAMAVALG